MTGQIVVASHSGDLVSRIPIVALRRIYKRNGETKIGQVQEGSFSNRELQAIDYSIRLTKGHYLFSRCWLLVEGETEFHLMPLLFDMMGYSQDQVSFSVLEISQVFGESEPFMKLANALGIPWLLMADGDSAGNKYVRRATQHIQAGIAEVQVLTYKNIEFEFWHNGFKDFIENSVPPKRKAKINLENISNQIEETASLIKAAIRNKGGKPAFAQVLADEIRRRGENAIPQSLQDIITRVIQLAKN